jgi:hypothetical protein
VGAAGGGAGVGVGAGAVAQPASTPRIVAAKPTGPATRQDKPMLLLLLESLAALGLLIFIVWWVMFAGRRKGERDDGPPGP